MSSKSTGSSSLKKIYRQLQNLKLVGGSFSEFGSLQSQIYDILESTNLENKEERDFAFRKKVFPNQQQALLNRGMIFYFYD